MFALFILSSAVNLVQPNADVNEKLKLYQLDPVKVSFFSNLISLFVYFSFIYFYIFQVCY